MGKQFRGNFFLLLHVEKSLRKRQHISEGTMMKQHVLPDVIFKIYFCYCPQWSGPVFSSWSYPFWGWKQPSRSKRRPGMKGAILTFSAPLQTLAVVWEDACHHYLFILGRKLFSPHVFSELTKAWQLPTVPFNRFCACRPASAPCSQQPRCTWSNTVK